MDKLLIVFVVCVTFTEICLATPKKYTPPTDSFLPSSNYYKKPKQLETSPTQENVNNTEQSASSSDRAQRFGVSAYGSPGYAGNGYSSSLTPGVYAPLKIDLGGVVLGTLIGLGAVLIFPKIAYALGGAHGHGGYGGYGRSNEEESGLTELVASIEAMLDKYNIDASSCMQRLVCSTVQTAKNNKATGEPTTADQWVEILTTNTLFTNMLDGTAIKQAVDAGWSENKESCTNFQPKCELNKQTIMQLVSQILPA